MQCIRIGDIALLLSRASPSLKLGKRLLPVHRLLTRLFSGYSNGGFGYIPTREGFAEGGYETEATPFAPDAAEVLADWGKRMLTMSREPIKGLTTWKT